MARKALIISSKLAGWCGILAPVVGTIFVGLAVYFGSSWFSWTDNWISDLGGGDGDRPIWSAMGTESVLLNFGLIFTGLMGMVFASGVRRIQILDSERGRLGTLLLVIDMISLTLVGVFPLTLQIGHYIVALTFFLLFPLSLPLIGIALWERGGADDSAESMKLGSFALILGVIAILLFPTLAFPRPWGGNAIVEILAVIPMASFSMVFGYGLVKGKFEPYE